MEEEGLFLTGFKGRPTPLPTLRGCQAPLTFTLLC